MNFLPNSIDTIVSQDVIIIQDYNRSKDDIGFFFIQRSV